MNRKYLIKFFVLITSILLLLNSCTFDESDAGDPGNGDPNSTIPNSPSPVDGELNVDNSVKLSWRSAGAESYDVKFDSKNPPTELIENNTINNSTNVIAPGLGTTYY